MHQMQTKAIGLTPPNSLLTPLNSLTDERLSACPNSPEAFFILH